AAMNKNDFEAAKKVVRDNFSKGFVLIEHGKKQNRDQFIAGVAPKGGTVSSFHFVIGKVTQKGDKANVQISVNFKGTMKGADGKQHPLNGNESDLETWTNIGG